MGLFESVLIAVYFFVGLYHLGLVLKIVYGFVGFAGFVFLRFLLCPVCPLYGNGCSVGWDEVGRFFKLGAREKRFFPLYTKLATFYWIFLFLFPLVFVPDRENIFLIILLPIVVIQVARCKKCRAADVCFFGRSVNVRSKKT
ncbi:hypothetical protein [Desulfurobacterium sp.]